MAEEEAGILSEIFSNPLNLILVGIITFLLYKIFKKSTEEPAPVAVRPSLPKLKKQDFTVEELLPYDGNGPEGRILVAVNGKVFDVTAGKQYYGPGGPYAVLGGRDASRSLGTFSMVVKDVYDDLSDLSSDEMNSIKEWEVQFNEKYEYVGRLLKPGEQHTNYSDEDEDTSTTTEPQQK